MATKSASVSKHGGYMRGHTSTSKAVRVAMGKVPASKVDSPIMAMKPVSAVASVP